MKLYPVFILCGLLLAIWTCPVRAGNLPAEEPAVATVSKVISDVTRKEADKEWQKARPGELLRNGDRVRTGDRSIAIIKFKDNSLIRLRALSELTVTGTQAGNAFSKSVDIDRGGVGFTIAKQHPDEEFRFTSPTSVASIRGTGGQYIVTDGGDTLIVLTGTISFSNRKSGNVVTVEAGFTGLANPDGSITSRPSTDDEKKSAAESVRTGDQPMNLEFDLRDGEGKARDLHIDYKQ